MKVTFCAYDRPKDVGGPNAWLRRIIPALHCRGIQLRVLFITQGAPEECPTVSFLRQKGFDCPAVVWPKYTEDRVHWLLKELAEDLPDVFVPNLSVSAYYAGRWAREAGIPTVGVLRSDDDFHRGLLREFVCGSKSFRLSGLVCVSRFLEQSVADQQPHDTVVSRIPSGVPLSPRIAEPLNGGNLRLMYIGRLVEEQKRITDVTRALCRVVREVSGTEAIIYGDGPEAARVKEIIRTEGKGLPVQFAGRIDSGVMQNHLVQGHALVLLSDYEGVPVALMEAMACGVVPICLQIRSGVGELIEHGVTGLLVQDRGKDFISAVQRLRQDPLLWKRLSSAARVKVEDGYTIEFTAERWKELLIRLHQSSGPRSTIVIPTRLSLPPVRPALAYEDKRKPSAFAMLRQRLMTRAANLKNQLVAAGRSAGTLDRLYPSLFSNRYYHLRLLRQRMEFVSREYLPKKETSVLVDLGCGTMPYRPIFEKYVAKYIGVDLMRNEAADSYVDSNGRASLANATADVVLSTQVLEHVEAPTSYLLECHRLLKPAGILILSTHGHWMYHADPIDLWRWTGEGLKKIIIEAGFQIIDLHGLMGLAAMGSYFLQDGLTRRVPRTLRPLFFLIMQAVAVVADKFHSTRDRSLDASVFVVVARKPDLLCQSKDYSS